uniref:DUF4806 domain-containing protein n=1 Tax=Parastrongyloides trichosuri TaxID=131310 RepID=A0A0N4Z117_PARTI
MTANNNSSRRLTMSSNVEPLEVMEINNSLSSLSPQIKRYLDLVIADNKAIKSLKVNATTKSLDEILKETKFDSRKEFHNLNLVNNVIELKGELSIANLSLILPYVSSLLGSKRQVMQETGIRMMNMVMADCLNKVVEKSKMKTDRFDANERIKEIDCAGKVVDHLMNISINYNGTKLSTSELTSNLQSICDSINKKFSLG